LKRKWLFQLIGIILFLLILYKLDLRNAISLISEADLGLLGLALALIIPFVLLKSLRWNCLLRLQDIDYSFGSSTQAYLSSMYLGLVTPGRIGDFAKVLYLKKEKSVSLAEGFSSVFVDRLFDLLLLLIMACAGVLTFALPTNILLILLVLLALSGAGIALFTTGNMGRRMIHFLLRLVLPKSRQDIARDKFDVFYSAVQHFKTPGIIYPALLTVAGYAIFYLQCYLIALSVDIPISYMNSAFSISTANLISLLPISISGIGTRDATLISIFSVLGLSKESALVFSILFLVVSNLSACVIGAVAWFGNPVDLKN